MIDCQRHNDKQALVHDLIPDLKVKEILYILNFGKPKASLAGLDFTFIRLKKLKKITQ